MNRLTLIFPLLITLCLTLVGCGGTTNPDTVPGGAAGGGGGQTGGQNTVRLGSFDNTGIFRQGQLNASPTTLAAGDSANLMVALLDGDDTPVTDAASVFFSSSCINSGLSEVDPAIANNTAGTVQATYTARGCIGADTITARTSVGGTTLTATATLQTAQAELGALAFDSVNRNVIGLQGTGQIPEQATVNFLVTDNNGTPVSGQNVSFALNTGVGGVSLSRTQDISGSDGRVSTVVTSGTQNTSVRVTATAMRNGVTTTAQSSALSITTGIPDNDSFSISATRLNIEGLQYDGVTTNINILAADRFNNPVPDNTAVNFRTEGGAVIGSCLTVDGGCSVELRSQAPRPTDGRVTVLATAIGEETFADNNPGDGRFEDSEFLPGQDLSEPFLDNNFDGARQSGEPFIDTYNPGSFDPPNGRFEGLLCDATTQTLCGPRDTVTVRNSIEIIFSGSNLFVDISPDPIQLTTGGVGVDVVVSVQDVNGQRPPAGTNVTATTTQGAIVGPNSFVEPSRNSPGPSTFRFRLEPSMNAGNGTFRVSVVTPGPDQTIGGGDDTTNSDTADVQQMDMMAAP